VENSYAAYPEHKVGLEFFGKLRELAAGYPFYVVETVKGDVVGFGLMRPYHSCDTFKGAAEVSYFILPEHTRKGLGTKLLDAFTEEARKIGVDTLLVDISSRNVASLDFHRKSGFLECGRFKCVGKKFGENFVVWMQKHIE
jgi:phosphinothricin acetyltransferase